MDLKSKPSLPRSSARARLTWKDLKQNDLEVYVGPQPHLDKQKGSSRRPAAKGRRPKGSTRTPLRPVLLRMPEVVELKTREQS